jgi:hypothetical protein
MSSQQGARLVYRNAVKSMIRAGVDPKSAVLSQSYLRLEQAVNTSKTQYSFGVLVNDSGNSGVAVRPTEQRLNLQDSFYVSQVSLYLGLATNTNDTQFPLYTWNNPYVFTTAGASSALNNLYNGNISLTVNNRTIVTAWDCYRHLEINQTQQTSTTYGSASQGSHDQICGSTSTAVDTEPNWVLIGSKNNSFQINLPNAIGTVQASTTTYLTVILRGVLAQNVTIIS